MLLVISWTRSVEIGNNRRDGLVEICRHDRPRCCADVELKAVNRKVKSGGKLLADSVDGLYAGHCIFEPLCPGLQVGMYHVHW